MEAVKPVLVDIAAQPVNGQVTGRTMQQLWERHLSSTDPLAQLLITGVRHDDAGEHDRLWVDVLQRLVDAGTARLNGWTDGYNEARLWPALIAMTAVGLTAVRRGRDDLLITVNTAVTGRGRAGTEAPSPAALLLHPDYLLAKSWVDPMPRWGQSSSGWIYPSSHLLKADLRSWFDDLAPIEADWVDLFHGWEYRLGLIQRHEGPSGYMGPHAGEFVGAYQWTRDAEGLPLAELAFIADQRKTTNSPWPSYLGEDVDTAVAAYRDILRSYRSRY